MLGELCVPPGGEEAGLCCITGRKWKWKCCDIVGLWNSWKRSVNLVESDISSELCCEVLQQHFPKEREGQEQQAKAATTSSERELLS